MEQGTLARVLLQAQMDKMVSEKLGTLKNEFPVKQLEEQGVVFDAVEMLLDAMEESTRKFFVDMRQRVVIERSKKAPRIRVLSPNS